DCVGPDELSNLPAQITRLEVACLGEYSRSSRRLSRYSSLVEFSADELSDDIDFRALPERLTRLSLGATSSTNSSTIKHLKNLKDLSLNLRPGPGGSAVPGSPEENLSSLDVADLPQTLTRLKLANLRLDHPEDLTRLNKLEELTVDRYN